MACLNRFQACIPLWGAWDLRSLAEKPNQLFRGQLFSHDPCGSCQQLHTWAFKVKKKKKIIKKTIYPVLAVFIYCAFSPHSHPHSFSNLHWTGSAVHHRKDTFKVRKHHLFLRIHQVLETNMSHILYMPEMLHDCFISSCPGLKLWRPYFFE